MNQVNFQSGDAKNGLAASPVRTQPQNEGNGERRGRPQVGLRESRYLEGLIKRSINSSYFLFFQNEQENRW